VVALRATGRLVPAFRRGMSLPYGVRAELLQQFNNNSVGKAHARAAGRAFRSAAGGERRVPADRCRSARDRQARPRLPAGHEPALRGEG
ncbi:MAG: hypothetical protein IKS21_04580, partial [Oscillospiraceae bacterium]|nr:hypothetical protein [Oscillospiraceae bacterium]